MTPFKDLPQVLALVAVVFGCGPVQADVLFQETFDSDAADTAAFIGAYPAFTVGGDPSVPVSVADGRLVITNDTNSNIFANATVSGIGGDVTYSLDIGALDNNGAYNVGLQLGQNRIVFHPGFPTGGALRVEGPGGFGNQDMGFVPANGTLHHLEVKQNAASGLFEITLTDGDVPTNIYTNSFTNLDSVGGTFGPVRAGPRMGAIGFFDNLVVEDGNTTDLKVTNITLLPEDRIELTWNSKPGAVYSIFYSSDLTSFGADSGDDFDSDGETTTVILDINSTPTTSPRLFFIVVENG